MNQNETGSNSTFLSIPKYAKTINRSRQAVYEDIAAGRIPAVRFGPRCLRIPASFLDRVAQKAIASVSGEASIDEDGNRLVVRKAES